MSIDISGYDAWGIVVSSGDTDEETLGTKACAGNETDSERGIDSDTVTSHD